ncbi:hypothetical protein DPMN_161049 [Dreissena polymorpha]|uniref:Uncharacterized protein n=1 Tax=Dreissena polymorpha TaxID=45954 RepID=A0A9D4ENY4_DREPO|nr:hypothetical protein DPMN_161049 [Dreissena polymorpha]
MWPVLFVTVEDNTLHLPSGWVNHRAIPAPRSRYPLSSYRTQMFPSLPEAGSDIFVLAEAVSTLEPPLKVTSSIGGGIRLVMIPAAVNDTYIRL